MQRFCLLLPFFCIFHIKYTLFLSLSRFDKIFLQFLWHLSDYVHGQAKTPAAQIEFQDLFFFFFRWKEEGSCWLLQKEHHHGIKVFFGPYLDYPLTRLWDDFWQLRKSWPPTYLHYIALTCLQHYSTWFRSTSTLLIIIQHGSMFGMFVAKSIQVSKKIYLPFLWFLDFPWVKKFWLRVK